MDDTSLFYLNQGYFIKKNVLYIKVYSAKCTSKWWWPELGWWRERERDCVLSEREWRESDYIKIGEYILSYFFYMIWDNLIKFYNINSSDLVSMEETPFCIDVVMTLDLKSCHDEWIRVFCKKIIQNISRSKFLTFVLFFVRHTVMVGIEDGTICSN